MSKDGMERYSTDDGSNTAELWAAVCFINDADYEKYLQENGFDKNVYMNTEEPVALALNFMKTYNTAKGSYFTYEPLKN